MSSKWECHRNPAAIDTGESLRKSDENECDTQMAAKGQIQLALYF